MILGVLKSFWLKSVVVIGWTLCKRSVWRTPGLVGSLYPTTKAIKVLPQPFEGNLAIAFWNPIIENFGHKNPVVAMGVTQSWLLLTAMMGVPHAPAEGQSLYNPHPNTLPPDRTKRTPHGNRDGLGLKSFSTFQYIHISVSARFLRSQDPVAGRQDPKKGKKSAF